MSEKGKEAGIAVTAEDIAQLVQCLVKSPAPVASPAVGMGRNQVEISAAAELINILQEIRADAAEHHLIFRVSLLQLLVSDLQ